MKMIILTWSGKTSRTLLNREKCMNLSKPCTNKKINVAIHDGNKKLITKKSKKKKINAKHYKEKYSIPTSKNTI